MARLVWAVLAVAVLVAAPAAGGAGGPVTKQNGKTPVFSAFTSICAVPGYLSYGFCDGDASRFTDVRGKVNAVQAKAGVWNLGISFSNLTPGATYRLWGNQEGAEPTQGVIDGFFVIGTEVAAENGTVAFSYQTNNVSKLGLDLNALRWDGERAGVTLVTSYWSEQAIEVLDADGTLYVPGS